MSRDHLGDSPFLKRVLVPFWIVRLLIMGIDLIVYGLIFVFVSANRDKVQDVYDKYDVDISISALLGIVAVIFLVIAICFLLDLLAIVMRCRHSLRPRTFLIFNVIQSTIWIVLCGLSFAGPHTVAGIIINVIVLLSFLGLLGYAAMIYHRERKGLLARGNYSTSKDVALEHGHFDQHYEPYNNHNNMPLPPQYQNASYAEAPEPKDHANASYYGPSATPSAAAYDTHELNQHRY